MLVKNRQFERTPPSGVNLPNNLGGTRSGLMPSTGKAASCGSGGGGGVAYEARRYKQGWTDGKADGPNRATHNVLCN